MTWRLLGFDDWALLGFDALETFGSLDIGTCCNFKHPSWRQHYVYRYFNFWRVACFPVEVRKEWHTFLWDSFFSGKHEYNERLGFLWTDSLLREIMRFVHLVPFLSCRHVNCLSLRHHTVSDIIICVSFLRQRSLTPSSWDNHMSSTCASQRDGCVTHFVSGPNKAAMTVV